MVIESPTGISGRLDFEFVEGFYHALLNAEDYDSDQFQDRPTPEGATLPQPTKYGIYTEKGFIPVGADVTVWGKR